MDECKFAYLVLWLNAESLEDLAVVDMVGRLLLPVGSVVETEP
jgi:hypothetical protein